jgi:hypothetical protein
MNINQAPCVLRLKAAAEKKGAACRQARLKHLSTFHFHAATAVICAKFLIGERRFAVGKVRSLFGFQDEAAAPECFQRAMNCATGSVTMTRSYSTVGPRRKANPMTLIGQQGSRWNADVSRPHWERGRPARLGRLRSPEFNKGFTES